MRNPQALTNMAERKTILLRAGALFGTMMDRSAARSGGEAICIGLASAAGVSGGAFVAAEYNASDAAEAQERLTSEKAGRKEGSVIRSVSEQLSFGGILGFATGYSIRRVGRVILFLVGTEVVLLQYMAYREWLMMDWGKVRRDVAPRFDRSTWDGLVQILTYNMPFSAAFSGGLVAGLRLSSAK